MKNYILSIDTETTGIPARWDLPYTDHTWPRALQIAWVVSDLSGKTLKQEDYYIFKEEMPANQGDAASVHQISAQLLQQKGVPIAVVLSILQKDLQAYDPLVIGHFIKLDYHIIGMECFRLGMGNILKPQPLFCTMIASASLAKDYAKNYLRLVDLYELFSRGPQPHPHNALYDAKATLYCFFKLNERSVLSLDMADMQYPLRPAQGYEVLTNRIGWMVAMLAIMLLLFLLMEWQFH